MKKKFLKASLCFNLLTSMALISCNKVEDNKSALSSINDVYGMGAVSSVKLLGSNMSVSAVKSLFEVRYANNSESENNTNDVKEQVEKFNEYFMALDSFLGEDIVTTKTENNTDSDYMYETKMTISGKDFNGENVSYTMYYTETLVNEEIDEEESESKYQLVGVMLFDGKNYHLEGNRLVESEDNEEESELKIRAYEDINDKSSFIEMEQEYSYEDGEKETEYVYSIYVNDELIEQTSVEFEREIKNNKVETEYEIKFIQGDYKGKYTLKREEKDNKDVIKVKYDIDGKTGFFHIKEISDDNNKQYEYTFSDGSKQLFNK